MNESDFNGIIAAPQHIQGEQWRRCGTDRCWIRNKLNKWWNPQLTERRWNGKCVQKQTLDCALCMKNAQSTITTLFICNINKCLTANDDKNGYQIYTSLSTFKSLKLCFSNHIFISQVTMFGWKNAKMKLYNSHWEASDNSSW